MTYPLVRLVAAPTATATVRYDFNDVGADAPRKVKQDSFTLGAPTLQTAPDVVSPLYGDRNPALIELVKGEKRDALEAIAVLSRELLRPTNWLLVQLDSYTRPTFWRLRATGPEAIGFDQVYVDTQAGDPLLVGPGDTWAIPVTMTAEAFGYGERITLDAVTVTQTPTGMRIVLPTIHGDALTALRVSITPDTASGGAGRYCAWLMSSVCGTSDMDDRVVDIGTGDGFTAGAGTGAGSSDSHYFGGKYRPVTIGAAEPLDTTRLSGTLPNLPLGQYKVLLRCEADHTLGAGITQTYLFRLATMASATDNEVYGPTTPVPVGYHHDSVFSGWVDLGQINYPLGVAAFDVQPDGQAAPATGGGVFGVQFTTADGSTGAVRMDALKFIPISGPTVSRTTTLKTRFPGFYWPVAGTTPSVDVESGTWDGDTETYWTTAVAPTVNTGVLPSVPELEGGFVVADPAADQNLLILMATDTGGASFGTSSTCIGSTGAQATAVVSYHPRLLHLDGRP